MHLGKVVPWTPLYNVRGLTTNTIARNPVRKLICAVDALAADGTIASEWVGVEVLSTIAEYWLPDQNFLTWTFVHPDHSDWSVVARWTLAQKTFNPLANLQYDSHVFIEAYEGATLLARSEKRIDWLTTFVFTTGPFFGGNAWTDKSDVAKWNTLTFRCKSARWEDDPDYQPYVTDRP